MHRPIQCSLAIVVFLLTCGCEGKKNLSPDYPIRPVAFTAVELNDPFWSSRIRINHDITIPIAFEKAEETGRIRNFKIAGGIDTGHFCSLYPFDDSDVFKNIEAASYSLQIFHDPILESYLDTITGYIAAAQEEDGYLYTNRTIDPGKPHSMAGPNRWEFVDQHSHELYNAGHLYEAAVAHFQATGKRNLLDVALKNADLIERTFGWGKLEKVPGHQEIEIGLVKLFRITGERKYLDLAKFFLDCRGPGGSEYSQQHKKVVDQDSAVGHAVRAQYMYAAMADVAALTGDQAYLESLSRIWHDITGSKTYITGGIGAAGDWEGFGPPYYLPNREAYCETCAAIANAFWNYRMFLLSGEGKYMDIFERVLWNGLLSGVSLSGDLFFYPNPLAADSTVRRKPWFGCACCPVNITRFLPSLPGYIYATCEAEVYVNLFMNSSTTVNVDGNKLAIRLETEYPSSGKISLAIDPEKAAHFELKVRVPGWARNEVFPSGLYTYLDQAGEQPILMVNGKEREISVENGYACILRKWNQGDKVELYLPMPVRMVRADERVKDDLDRIAIQLGPVVYALEGIDQPEGTVANLVIEPGSRFSSMPLDNKLAEGLTGVSGPVGIISMGQDNRIEKREGVLKAIPYFLWANRSPSDMQVWTATKEDIIVKDLLNLLSK